MAKVGSYYRVRILVYSPSNLGLLNAAKLSIPDALLIGAIGLLL